MAKIGQKIIEAVVSLRDGDVTFGLREPTNEELGRFSQGHYDVSRKGKVRETSFAARCAFFDSLLVWVKDLEDSDGTPITEKDLAKIPGNWKAAIIMESFEQVEVNIKNS